MVEQQNSCRDCLGTGTKWTGEDYEPCECGALDTPPGIRIQTIGDPFDEENPDTSDFFDLEIDEDEDEEEF